MSLSNRNGLITVRLSEEELKRLKSVCQDRGARSISDFVRAMIVQKIGSRRVGNGHLAGDLESIAEKLEDLDKALNDLSGQITNVLGRRAQRDHKENAETAAAGKDEAGLADRAYGEWQAEGECKALSSRK